MNLTIKCDEESDWYVIERAVHNNKQWLEAEPSGGIAYQHSGRFSDADVEGNAEEMRMVAVTIEQRGQVSFKRVAVNATGDPVTFCSPRNSRRDGECTLAEALELAKEIHEKLGLAVVAPVEDEKTDSVEERFVGRVRDWIKRVAPLIRDRDGSASITLTMLGSHEQDDDGTMCLNVSISEEFHEGVSDDTLRVEGVPANIAPVEVQS